MTIGNTSVRQRVGSWQTASMVAPDAPVASRSKITLHRKLKDGSEIEREFDVIFDADAEVYFQSAEDEGYSTEFTDQSVALQTVLPELLTEAEREISVDSDDDCAYPLDAELGSATTPSVVCFDFRPTFEEIARRALDFVGMELAVHRGAGLPHQDRKVDFEYRTEGKTVQAVISETILLSGPRWWGEGNLFTVDGRPLQTAGLPTVLNAAQIERRIQVGADPVQPVLEATGYDPPPGCSDTFETAEAGTRIWTEKTGTGDNYTEITYGLVKAAGQITQETERRHGFVPVTDGPPVFALVYDSIKTHEYHASCDEALVRTVEVVRTARQDFTYWNFSIDAGVNGLFPRAKTIADWLPPLFETSRKEVSQRWYADGTLKQRTEIHFEAAGVAQTVFGSAIGNIVYKRSSRTEEYTPIGGGQWLMRVTEQVPSEKPVFEITDAGGPFGQGFEIQGTFPVGSTNTWSRTTDGPPPSVTCGEQINSCDPNQTPEDKAQEKFDFETDTYNAILAIQPDKYVWTVQIQGLDFAWRVGQFIAGAFVAGASFAVQPSDGVASTEVELWMLKT